MGNGDTADDRRAAACDRCGEIGIVSIRPDDTLQPLGQPTFCEPPALRVLESDLDAEEPS